MEFMGKFQVSFKDKIQLAFFFFFEMKKVENEVLCIYLIYV